MGILLTVVIVIIVGLLIVVGVIISVRLQRMLIAGRFRRVRHVRTVTSAPDGSIVEKTVTEAIPAESPVTEPSRE